jgi:hypothetical protein
MHPASRPVAVLISSILALVTLGFSQSATTSLRGTISDAKGAVISGATVTLSSAATGRNGLVT